MAVRRWAVQAQEEGVEVDRNEVISALMDGEALLWRAGGVLTVLPYRQPTQIPGEMVTTGVIFEWKDRTDAKQQPETPTAPPAAPVLVTPAEPVIDEERLRAEAVAQMTAAPGAVGDGLDESQLPDEDLSSVEAA